MNNHFNKLTTPLLSLPHYPTLRSQARRFLDAGYTQIEAVDLNSFFYASMPKSSLLSLLRSPVGSPLNLPRSAQIWK
jgi:hypothetical protein